MKDINKNEEARKEVGANSHAAIVALSLDVPALLGAAHATEILKMGAIVTLDGEKGSVSCNSSRME